MWCCEWTVFHVTPSLKWMSTFTSRKRSQRTHVQSSVRSEDLLFFTHFYMITLLRAVTQVPLNSIRNAGNASEIPIRIKLGLSWCWISCWLKLILIYALDFFFKKRDTFGIYGVKSDGLPLWKRVYLSVWMRLRFQIYGYQRSNVWTPGSNVFIWGPVFVHWLTNFFSNVVKCFIMFSKHCDHIEINTANFLNSKLLKGCC